MFSFMALALSLIFAANQAPHNDPIYAPLWLYQGTWQSTTAGAQKTETILDECSLTGKFFSCQQTVDGKIVALIVFVPTDKPGFYHTQGLTPEGFATGRGDLEIAGEHWTYASKAQEKGQTTYYRTTNAFTGHDRIHFEQSESADSTHWKVVSSGEELRVPPKG